MSCMLTRIPVNVKKEKRVLNIRKKLLGILVLICLVVNIVPVASATEVNEDARKGLDYSKLEMQVAIANGLTSYEYTMESWEHLQESLEIGKTLLEGIYDQGKLDRAAEDIANALTGLVKMDYASLTAALEAVENKINEEPELYDIWHRLSTAAEDAKALLISGDQQAVDAAADNLVALLNELSECSAMNAAPEVVIQEVEVEVLPTNDFCNIPAHRTWVVLFGISAVLNVVLIAVLIGVIEKKRKSADDTPLVDYDIDDDLDF